MTKQLRSNLKAVIDEPHNSKKVVLPNERPKGPERGTKQSSITRPNGSKGWANKHKVVLITYSPSRAHVTPALRPGHTPLAARVNRETMDTHTKPKENTHLSEGRRYGRGAHAKDAETTESRYKVGHGPTDKAWEQHVNPPKAYGRY